VKHKVYLGLGANLDNRRANILEALRQLSPTVKITARSSFYDTAPVSDIPQPRYLNLVCAGETTLSPAALLLTLKQIEAAMRRQPGPPNSPRPIDIDILFYDNLIINTPELVVPHPRLTERVFVLMPLAEIAPALKHPLTGNPVNKMLGALRRTPGDIIKIDTKDIQDLEIRV